MTAESQGPAQAVAALREQNLRTREQFDRTRSAVGPLWELWAGEAAALLGAEWELADGRARALLDEEAAALALLPAAHPAMEEPRRPPSGTAGTEWQEAQLFQLMEHAAAHLRAQEQELAAALAAREALIGQAEAQAAAGDAAARRLWIRRAQDVVQRLAKLGSGVRGALEAYTKANRLNTRMFRADLFAERAEEPGSAAPGEEQEVPGFYGQLSPAGFYALADLLVAANKRLLTALIAAELDLEAIGPLVRRRQQGWARQYDLRSQAAFLLAGDCLRAMGLLARAVRQAGRNWEVAEWGAGEGRGVLPVAATVTEVVEMRIAPPPSALAASAGEPGQGTPGPAAPRQAEQAWRALAGAVDSLDAAVVAASGFDSEEAAALESAISQVAARLYAVQDGASDLADVCAALDARQRKPWWRRGSFRASP